MYPYSYNIQVCVLRSRRMCPNLESAHLSDITCVFRRGSKGEYSFLSRTSPMIESISCSHFECYENILPSEERSSASADSGGIYTPARSAPAISLERDLELEGASILFYKLEVNRLLHSLKYRCIINSSSNNINLKDTEMFVSSHYGNIHLYPLAANNLLWDHIVKKLRRGTLLDRTRKGEIHDGFLALRFHRRSISTFFDVVTPTAIRA